MIIKKAEFVCSNTELTRLPADGRPEYAFIGRSNVGKSSLINALTGRKSLAMTSSTPGKTMLINHFIVNDDWYLVDLPGYGYARRSKVELQRLDKMIRTYVTKRSQLTCLFVLVDSRHEPQRIDLEFIRMLGEQGVPFCIVFTKADKEKPLKVKTNIEAFNAALREEWDELPPEFLTSSKTKDGCQELTDYIGEVNKQLQEQGAE